MIRTCRCGFGNRNLGYDTGGITMHFSQKQINELNLGTSLATEIIAQKGMRKFIHVGSYLKDSEGRHKSVRNKCYNDNSILHYSIVIYSISSDVIENDWDIGDNIIYHYRVIDIKEILTLENQIKRYLDDLSSLLPSWYCDDVL